MVMTTTTNYYSTQGFDNCLLCKWQCVNVMCTAVIRITTPNHLPDPLLCHLKTFSDCAPSSKEDRRCRKGACAPGSVPRRSSG